ncbi:hypothetical protein [Soonwooa sp.]|uniref:hypothetical protein n=1 Tax=Soonwooa sp. TaxID=1938592 RepID=UPI0028A5CA96|nr:hypothetical protein [Soonwooa sp.]
MQDIELMNQSISDLEQFRDMISERHKDNPTLTLRFSSVFNQLINSLGVHTGAVATPSNVAEGFTPQPLKMVFGKDVTHTEKRKLKPFEVDDVAAMRERMQHIYDSFLDRENNDLKESLQEIEIRGVAKMAGVEDFDTQKIDGHFLNKIKKAIADKSKDDENKAAVKAKLAQENVIVPVDAVIGDQKKEADKSKDDENKAAK